MRWMQQTVLAVGLLCIVQEPAYAAKATFLFDKFGSEEFECWHSQVAGSFTANSAKYSISGSCILNIQKLKIPWTAQGSYDARTANGQVDEKIVVNGQSPFRGEFRLKMVCNTRRTGASFDPWLWLGDDKCTQIQIEATGEMAGTITINNTATDFVKLILNRAQGRGGPVTASFPYDRQPLLAKRVNDLRAEAEALAAEKRRAEQLLQGTTLPSGPSGPYTALIHPSVLEPKAGQILAPQRPVPIKLGPPKGWDVTGYTVIIQRRDPNGTWVNHTTIPIGATVAHSPTGYTGFGGGAPPAFLMTPGGWRLSAQVKSPKQSGVSEWVEFSALESADFTAKKRPSSVFPSTGQSTMQSTLPPKGLPGGMVSPPSVLYGIASTGALGWYRHNGAQIGAGLNAPGAWSGPTDVGSGWQNFKEVFGMGDGIIYAIAGDGKLKWYKHTGFRDGTKAWDGPKDVGTGWQNFKQVFGAGNGVIYAIAGDGILKWYKHTGYQDGSFAWEGPKNVGTGWQNFKEVFGMGDGIIYAIAGDGKLKWYKHTGFRDGTFAWEGPKDVGTGWQNFKQVFGAGNGVIYAIGGNGILNWYKHTGYRDGTFRWEGAKDIGTGWQGFTTVLSLLP